METMPGALNLLLLRGPEVNVGRFPASQLLADEGERQKITWSQVSTVGGMGKDLDVLPP